MSKLKLEEKISNLETQSKRQGEKVSLLLEQVEELKALNQKLLLLIEESLYETEKQSAQEIVVETKVESRPIEFLKTILENKPIFN